MTKCVLIVQLEIPQIPLNLFVPSAQIGQLFGIFKKKTLITCSLSMHLTQLQVYRLQMLSYERFMSKLGVLKVH